MLYLSTPSSASQFASMTLLACLGLLAPAMRAFFENCRKVSSGASSILLSKITPSLKSYDSGSFRLRQECEPACEPTLSLLAGPENVSSQYDPIDSIHPILTLRLDALFPDSDTSSYASVGRITVNYLQQKFPATPIRLESTLMLDVGLTDAQIGETILALLFATGREYLPGILRYPIVTVEDLVLYLTVSPHLEAGAPSGSARQRSTSRNRSNAA